MRKFTSPAILIVFLFCSTLMAQQTTKPLVHPLFTDHMVLQRDKQVPIWGWAEPGTVVAVDFGGVKATATATSDGKWRTNLGPFTANAKGQTLRIQGPENVEFEDVLVGDVWICSGQSNMEWSVAASNDAEQEIANADHPQVRLFTVPKRVSLTPQELVDGQWSVCSSDTIARFSAVGYFFGRELNKQLDVPIGLIHTSWGGTVAEAWTSAEALESMPDFDEQLGALKRTMQQMESGEFDLAKNVAAWWKKVDTGSSNRWSHADFDHSDWKTMALPNNWEAADVGLDEFDGIVWFRKSFELPADWAGKDVVLNLGPIDDADTTWVNGHQVGSTDQWTTPRNYRVAAKFLKPGRNVIAIRVYDGSGGGGIYDTNQKLQITQVADADTTSLEAASSEKTISIGDDWHFKVSASKQGLPPFPQSVNNNPNTTTVLYNGMLAPLKPFGITGAIWYQGESNAGRAMQYRRLLPAMIQDWRQQMEQGDFPFLIVQLANFMQQQTTPVESGWAELREAQQLTSQRDANTGLAIITDIGEANDIHPRNKQDVGKRLALQAMKIAYKKSVVADGPSVKDMSIVGDTLQVEFQNVGGGLLVQGGGDLKGFAIAEAEGDFVWANASIDGNTVSLWHDKLAEPIRVRYNWANNPIGNLFNKEGLPAAPFRTDVPRTTGPPDRASIMPTAQPEEVGMSSSKLAKIKPAMQQLVDDGKVPGAIAVVARKGKIVYFDSVGYRDLANKTPMDKDSLLRFYSMTKAVTSVAVMMLAEEGKLKLDDAAEDYVPELKDVKVVNTTGAITSSDLVAQTRKMTVRDLLRHTSGLTYGLFGDTNVDRQYRKAGLLSREDDLQTMAEKLGKLPLLYQPGTRFNYSVSTDLLGHIVERVSGMGLGEFFQNRIFAPLQMESTSFHVDKEDAKRFANNYAFDGNELKVMDSASTSRYLQPPKFRSGGGGLVSDASDYIRFCQMLLNQGEFNGQRLLRSDTVQQMTQNQLPSHAYPLSLDGVRNGVGFGLGFSVVVEKTDWTELCHVGEYGWGGAASTHFWISPADDLAVVVLTQVMPFTFDLENAVKPIVYDAILD